MDVSDSVRSFIHQNFFVSPALGLGDGDSLLENGVVDSTGVLEVIQFLEREFGIHVEDDEVTPQNLDSIACIAAYVARKSGAPLRRNELAAENAELFEPAAPTVAKTG